MHPAFLGQTSGESVVALFTADNPFSTRGSRAYDALLMTIHIRPFHESDRKVVRQLTIAAFEGVSIDHNIDLRLGFVAGRDWHYRKSRDIDRDIDELDTLVAVAEDNHSGAVVGYVTMQCDLQTCIGWIHNLAVSTEARGHGLGRRLVEHALAHFHAAGMTIAKIETLEQNAVGRHLYPSVGFVEVARQIHYAMALLDPPAHEPGPETL
jgi:ribosomal protein S18 acetylase RimI-like enzyme